MPTTHPYDLVIGLDRSDRKADLHLLDTRSGNAQKHSVATSPEQLHDWLARLRQDHPQASVALCLEQPAANLIVFLETYSWITLYPINPISLQKFREAFVTSRAKDDGKDAQYLAELLLSHPDKLKAWQPDDSQTRQLQQLVFHRRAVVDQRTGRTNRLKALLKQYFPQALDLCGEDLWRPLARAFLLKWPTLQSLKKARKESLKQFYYLQGSRSQTLIEQRLERIDKAAAERRVGFVAELHAARATALQRTPTPAQDPSTVRSTDRQSFSATHRAPDLRSLPRGRTGAGAAAAGQHGLGARTICPARKSAILQRGRSGDQAKRGQMFHPSTLPLPEVSQAEFPRIRQGIDPAQPLGSGLLWAAAQQRMRPPHSSAGAGLQMAADHLEVLADSHHLQGGDLRGGFEEKQKPAHRPARSD